MTAPNQPATFADIGAQSMATVASLDEVTTISAAQTVNGLSTLLVSEGLASLIRDMMMRGHEAAGQAVPALPTPTAPPPSPGVAPPGAAVNVEAATAAATPASRDALLGMSAHALGEMLTRTVVSRIVDLNTVNTYLSLTSAEQLRQWGKRLAEGAIPSSGTSQQGGAVAGAPMAGVQGYPGSTGPPAMPGYWPAGQPGAPARPAGFPARPFPAFVPGPAGYGYRPPFAPWGLQQPPWCPPTGQGWGVPNGTPAWGTQTYAQTPPGYPQAPQVYSQAPPGQSASPPGA